MNVLFYLSRKDVIAAIQQTPYRYGATNLASALSRIGSTVVGSGRGPSLLLIITDGVANLNSDLTISAAHALRGTGAIISAVAVNLEDLTELKRVVNAPAENFLYSVDTYSQLFNLTPSFVQHLCQGTTSLVTMYLHFIGSIILKPVTKTKYSKRPNLWLTLPLTFFSSPFSDLLPFPSSSSSPSSSSATLTYM